MEPILAHVHADAYLLFGRPIVNRAIPSRPVYATRVHDGGADEAGHLASLDDLDVRPPAAVGGFVPLVVH